MLSKKRLALQELQPMVNVTNNALRGIADIPKGFWTKTTKGLPSNFSEEHIKAYHNKQAAKKHFDAGYRMFRSEKVKDLLLNYSLSDVVFCKAKVEASFSVNKKYATQIKLSVDGFILGGYCECAAGLGGVCKHVGAVLWFIFDVIKRGDKYIQESKACTEEERKWGVSSKQSKLSERKFNALKFVKYNPAKDVLPRKSVSHNHIDIVLKPEQLVNLHHALSESKLCPMLCSIIKDHDCLPVNLVGNATPSNDVEPDKIAILTEPLQIQRLPLPLAVLWADCDVGLFLNSNACSPVLDLEQVQELENKTRLQSRCPLWHSERLNRITASKFGDIVSRQAEVTTKFVQSIFKGGSFQNRYMEEGLKNEENATKKYVEYQFGKITTFNCGFVVNPGVPFLGCSPDKVVYDRHLNEFGLVEIKTLAKAKEMEISIAQAIQLKKASFLRKKCGTLTQNHKYYYQIQGQLALTGLDWCDLVVDSGVDMYIERVYFNKNLWVSTMLPKLAQFYSQYATNVGNEMGK